MEKKQILTSIVAFIVILSVVYIYFAFGDLIYNYNNLVENHNDLVRKYNDNLVEAKKNKLLIENYQEHITKLRELTEKLYIRNDNLTAELKEKNNEYNALYEEYWRDNDYIWTGCKDSRTILKFCKGCDWNLECTGSMRPTFSCENTLYFCRARKDEIKIGDIIAFSSPEYTNEDYEHFYTIHRVVEITPDGFRTKGDNNLYIDNELINYNKVVGKLYKIEGGK